MSPQFNLRIASPETFNPAGPNLESRVERDGRLTFRGIVTDVHTGITTETTYDANQRPIRIAKRSAAGSSSESHLDPETGKKRRLNELSRLPDGNTINREIVFLEHNRASEAVTVVGPSGTLAKIIERQHFGARTTFQGETTYDLDGNPSQTVNQHMEHDTGALKHREHIQWVSEGQRAMTEHFHFSDSGMLVRYSKTLHYFNAGPFSEETHEFHQISGHLMRREMVAYSPEGYQTCHDVLFYKEDGNVAERKSTFFDSFGNPIGARSEAREIGAGTWA